MADDYPRYRYRKDGTLYGYEIEPGVMVLNSGGRSSTPKEVWENHARQASERARAFMSRQKEREERLRSYDDDRTLSYVLSDMLQLSRTEVVTGFWTGQSFSVKIEEGKRFSTLAELRSVTEVMDLKDPLVYAVRLDGDSLEVVYLIEADSISGHWTSK
jgi:hypothetical protein